MFTVDELAAQKASRAGGAGTYTALMSPVGQVREPLTFNVLARYVVRKFSRKNSCTFGSRNVVGLLKPLRGSARSYRTDWRVKQ